MIDVGVYRTVLGCLPKGQDMGYDVGVYHCYGIMLSSLNSLNGLTKLVETANEAMQSVDTFESMEEVDDFAESAGVTEDDDHSQSINKITGPVTKDIVDFLETLGISAKDAYLIWTGDGDDRPGRCDTPSEEVILGFWMNDHDPRVAIEMSDSFAERASHYTWAWGG